MHLGDLFDVALLDKHVETGNVRRQQHPDLPLAILNYTAQAQYSGTWDEVTMACRGLIVDDHGMVVARPFGKFFNHYEPHAASIPLDAAVSVTDKADGSLGILYPTPDGHAVATRGSFTSEQALHAIEVWRERYERVQVPEGVTWLFEIVYPANRIVLDYGDLDDLVLIGGVHLRSGRWEEPLWSGWPGPRVVSFEHATLADALAATPRPNAEGLVVYHPASGERVKIKQEDYLRLHRVITGLNARVVWEHLADGKPMSELLDPLPDEFHAWTLDVAEQLTNQVSTWRQEATEGFEAVMALLGLTPGGPVDREDRKRFAEHAVHHPLKWALFALLDGRGLDAGLWRQVRPEGTWTPSGRTFSEDTA